VAERRIIEWVTRSFDRFVGDSVVGWWMEGWRERECECVRGWSSESVGEIVGSEWGDDRAEFVAPELFPLTRTNNSYMYI